VLSEIFRPKLADTLKHFDRHQFLKDIIAGVIVGLVALPLAISFAIASGVNPEKGLYTAVIAGFLISALGGSRVQIGGPTGAFVVIVYGIVTNYGLNGLIIATFIAGVMLVIMGFARLGSVIKYIPYPLIVGFTSGIALIIFSSQIKDFFGLQIGTVPADFVGKWKLYLESFQTTHLISVAIASATILIVVLWPRVTHKVPGSLVAIILLAAVVAYFHLDVETVGSRFGEIQSGFPSPAIPKMDIATIQHLIQPAFTIALLGGIESLLSAIVADGMIGGNHKSNMELVAQGTANIFSAIFGGIPATGAIARTATNVKNGGRTPIAGIVHAITLLLIMLLAGNWAALIPMPVLAGILIVVAYNMSEWENFRAGLKGPKGDMAVMLTTFALTVLVDLTVAIEIGLLLAVFLFMEKMIRTSEVTLIETENGKERDEYLSQIKPKSTEIFEIKGPLFFGAAYKFKDAIKLIEKKPRVLIIRMSKVPIIDATGLRTIAEVHKELRRVGIKLILSEVHSEQVMSEMKKTRLLFAIGKANVTQTLDDAFERTKAILD